MESSKNIRWLVHSKLHEYNFIFNTRLSHDSWRIISKAYGLCPTKSMYVRLKRIPRLLFNIADHLDFSLTLHKSYNTYYTNSHLTSNMMLLCGFFGQLIRYFESKYIQVQKKKCIIFVQINWASPVFHIDLKLVSIKIHI